MYALLTWQLSSFSVTIFSRTQVLCVTTVTALVQLPICNWPILMYFFFWLCFWHCQMSVPTPLSLLYNMHDQFLVEKYENYIWCITCSNWWDSKIEYKNWCSENYHTLLYLTITYTSSSHEWIYIQKYLELVSLIVFNLHSDMKYIFNIWSFSPPNL